MNDETLKQLMTLVERSVRPVRASLFRKKRMREELLDHASIAFDEEMQDGATADVALDRVRQRFGDSESLSRELQSSIGIGQRIEWRLEHLLRFRPGESVLRRAGRHAFLGFAAIAIEISALAIPTGLFAKADPDPFRSLMFLISIAIVVPTVVFLFTLLVHGLRETLFLGSRRSLLRGCVILAFVPLTVFAAVFAVGFALPQDARWFHDPLLIRNIAILAALTHVGLLAFASQTSKAIRYMQQWDLLPIED